MKTNRKPIAKTGGKYLLYPFFGLLMLFTSCNPPQTGNEEEEELPKNIERTEIDSLTVNEEVLEANLESDSTLLGEVEEVVEPSFELSSDNFLKHLNEEKELFPFFANEWTLVYHGSDRSDGEINGRATELMNTQIDDTIRLNLSTNGEGWGEPIEPRNYDLNFHLLSNVDGWPHFTKVNIGPPELNCAYFSPEGIDFIYLKAYYNELKQIIKLEYNVNDPG